MEKTYALIMTSRQAAALVKLIRMQAAAYAEAGEGEARNEELFTGEDLEAVMELLGLPFPGGAKPLMVRE